MGHRMAGSELMAHKMAGSAAKVSAEWTSILDLFPAYSDMFRQTQASLTSGNGPLPLLERRFIALMVSWALESPPSLHQQRSNSPPGSLHRRL